MITRSPVAPALTLLLLAACARSAAPPRADRYEDVSVGECTDGLDNDADGLPDCTDRDCTDTPLCQPDTDPRVEWEPFDTDDLRDGNRVVLPYAPDLTADLLLVLDDADRSAAALAALEAQLPRLAASLVLGRDTVPDWRLSVLTTDGSGALTPLLDLPYADPTTDPSAFAGWLVHLTTPETPDLGLSAVLHAPTSLRREGVALHVLVVSTSDDQASEPAPLLSELTRSLRTVTGGEVGGSLSAVVGPLGGCTDADEGTAYLNAAAHLDGFERSICEVDWREAVDLFARLAIGTQVRITVPPEVDPATLRVWVEDGAVTYDGYWEETFSDTLFHGPPSPNAKFLFRWNPVTSTVWFVGFAPSPGATLHVWWPDP